MNKFLLIISFVSFISCNNKTAIQSSYNFINQAALDSLVKSIDEQNKITTYIYNPFRELNNSIINIVLYDKFNPPVASRIFAYTNLTAHLVLSQFSLLNKPTTKLQLKNKIELKYDTAFVFAVALTAQKIVAKTLVWSGSKIETDFNGIINKWISSNSLQTNKKEIDSIAKIFADEITIYSQQDGYAERLANKRYEVLYDEEIAWKPTAPLYSLPVEPYWKKVKTFLIPDKESYKIKMPFVFSNQIDANFYKINNEVYQKSINLSDTEIMIAKHWDCNPIQSKNVGHVMLYTFRHTPAAHWLLIVSDIVMNSNFPIQKSVEMYSYLSLAMADATIVTWDMKYQYNLIRPETYINKYIKKEWRPILETPAFPEYPSGHSLLSTAAGPICNYYFGEDYSFVDSTQQQFGTPIRYYINFNQAAAEAGTSRFYGGIHYINSIEIGNQIGKRIGMFYVNDILK